MKYYLSITVLTALMSVQALSMESEPFLGEDQASLRPLMRVFSDKLVAFVRAEPMDTPAQRLAFLLVMSALVENMYDVISVASNSVMPGFPNGLKMKGEGEGSHAGRAARMAGGVATSEIRGPIDRHIISFSAEWADWVADNAFLSEAALTFAEYIRAAFDESKKMGNSVFDAHVSAYRLCEQQMQHWVVKNAHILIPKLYHYVADRLTLFDASVIVNNPFKYLPVEQTEPRLKKRRAGIASLVDDDNARAQIFDWDLWERFRAQYFGGLSQSRMFFLNPWLRAIDTMVFEKSLASAELCLQRKRVVRDIRKMILNLVAPEFIQRRKKQLPQPPVVALS